MDSNSFYRHVFSRAKEDVLALTNLGNRLLKPPFFSERYKVLKTNGQRQNYFDSCLESHFIRPDTDFSTDPVINESGRTGGKDSVGETPSKNSPVKGEGIQ